MPKFKPHKGLLKRVRITRNGQVKHFKAGSGHRKSLHSSAQNQHVRLSKIAVEVERKRAQKLLGFRIRRPKVARKAEAADD